MATKTWIFVLDGKRYVLEVDAARLRKQSEILLDDRAIQTYQQPAPSGREYVFQLEGHRCGIQVRTAGFKTLYFFTMDGVEILDGQSVDSAELSNRVIKPEEVAALQNRLKLERQMKNGAGWFYWIAGLSLINSIIYIFNGSFYFVIGLGFTQIVDGFAQAFTQLVNPGQAAIIRIIGLIINFGIAGGFIALGIASNKRRRGAFIAGMILYGIDLIIMIIVGDILSIIFHLIALVAILMGLLALNKLVAQEKSQTTAVPVLK